MKNKITIVALAMLLIAVFPVGGGEAQMLDSIQAGERARFEYVPQDRPANTRAPAPRHIQRQSRQINNFAETGVIEGIRPSNRLGTPSHRLWTRITETPGDIIPGEENPITRRTTPIRNPFALTGERFNFNDLPLGTQINIGMRTGDRWFGGGLVEDRGGNRYGADLNPYLTPYREEFPTLPEPTQVEPTITRQTSSLVRRRNFQVLSYDWTFINHTTRTGMSPWNRVPHDEAYVTFPTAGRWIVTIHPWNSWELHQYERIITTRIHPVTLDEITRISYRHVGYLRTVEGRHTSQPMQMFRILVIRPNETIRVPSPNQQFFESDFELIR